MFWQGRPGGGALDWLGLRHDADTGARKWYLKSNYPVHRG